MIKRGDLTARGFNICSSRGDGDIDRTLDACPASLVLRAAAMAAGAVASRLEGPMIKPVFRRA